MKKILYTTTMILCTCFAFSLNYMSLDKTGKLLALGNSESKKVVILDSETKTIKKTISLGANCQGLSFNNAGTILVVVEENGMFYFDPATGKKKWNIESEKLGYPDKIVYYPNKDFALLYTKANPAIKIVSLNEAKIVLETKANMKKTLLVGYNTLSDEIYVFGDATEFQEEEFITPNKFPAELKPNEKWIYGQEHDKMGSQLIILNGKTGALVADKLISYIVEPSKGAKVYASSMSTICAGGKEIILSDSAKKITGKAMPGFSNTASLISDNGEILFIGTFGDVRLISTSDWTPKLISLTKMDYVDGFSFDSATGKLYGITTKNVVFSIDTKTAGGLIETSPKLPWVE